MTRWRANDPTVTQIIKSGSAPTTRSRSFGVHASTLESLAQSMGDSDDMANVTRHA